MREQKEKRNTAFQQQRVFARVHIFLHVNQWKRIPKMADGSKRDDSSYCCCLWQAPSVLKGKSGEAVMEKLRMSAE